MMEPATLSNLPVHPGRLPIKDLHPVHPKIVSVTVWSRMLGVDKWQRDKRTAVIRR